MKKSARNDATDGGICEDSSDNDDGDNDGDDDDNDNDGTSGRNVYFKVRLWSNFFSNGMTGKLSQVSTLLMAEQQTREQTHTNTPTHFHCTHGNTRTCTEQTTSHTDTISLPVSSLALKFYLSVSIVFHFTHNQFVLPYFLKHTLANLHAHTHTHPPTHSRTPTHPHTLANWAYMWQLLPVFSSAKQLIVAALQWFPPSDIRSMNTRGQVNLITSASFEQSPSGHLGLKSHCQVVTVVTSRASGSGFHLCPFNFAFSGFGYKGKNYWLANLKMLGGSKLSKKKYQP